MFEVILPWVNPFTVIIYMGATLLVWFLLLTFEYGLNGGQLGRGRLWMFECFWEDIRMNIPGGAKIKADRIREMVETDGSGSFISLSSDDSWTYKELRESDEYEKCGRAMFGSAINFWTVRVIGYLLIAFILVPFLVLWMAVSIVGMPIYCMIDAIRRRRKGAAVH